MWTFYWAKVHKYVDCTPLQLMRLIDQTWTSLGGLNNFVLGIALFNYSFACQPNRHTTAQNRNICNAPNCILLYFTL